jgi:predicted small lipoprotein YifL
VSRWTSRSRHLLRQTAVLLYGIVGLLAACGVVGPPIPPEDVGVTPTINRQKAQHAREAQQRDAAAAAEADRESAEPMPQGQDVNLPPLRPVGTR